MPSLLRAARREPWIRLALVLWSLLYAAYVLKLFLQPNRPGVYPLLAAASRHWWQNLDPYADYTSLGLDLFRYPPTFAVLFTPFAMLPERLGSALWNLFSIVVLVISLRVLVHRVFPFRLDDRAEGLVLVLTFAACCAGSGRPRATRCSWPSSSSRQRR